MANETYPLKNVRLEQLHQAGFNVADFICFPPRTLSGREDELRAFLARHSRISCRHFHEDETRYYKCPVLYDQDDIEKILAFCLEYNQTFFTLCNEALKLSDSIFAGNILVRSKREYAIEYFSGEGTPRDIEAIDPARIKYFERKFGSPMPSDVPEAIQSLRTSLNEFATTLPITPVIIEFSIYPYPVGRRKSNAICWEWRKGWLHYAMQHNINLMAENEKLRKEVERLQRQIEQLSESSYEDPIPEFSGRSFQL
ncbi:MAG: hypothetical protein AAB799_01980 [Patescibacteria group bacterium]